jgi:hypothetical protein
VRAEDRARVIGISSPTLHIVFGQSAGGTLKVALREASRDEEVLSFEDDLSFGPIHPPIPMVRAAWARAELYFPAEATGALRDVWDRHSSVGNAWYGFHGERRANSADFLNWSRSW